MHPNKIDMDRDLMEVYHSEVRRPGYVLQLGDRHQAKAENQRPLTATIRERDTNRHAVVDHRRQGH
jgi:hypothetical protein